MSERHEAFLRRHSDGTVTVEHADPVVWVSPELIRLAEDWALPAGRDGDLLQLDTAGEYVYRRTGSLAAYLVYERVTGG